MALFPWLPRSASTRKVKPIWILLKQETVSVIGISWAICKSAPCSRQTTTSEPHHSVFYRPDAMPFLLPNQQRQSTEGNQCFLSYHLKYYINVIIIFQKVACPSCCQTNSSSVVSVTNLAVHTRRYFATILARSFSASAYDIFSVAKQQHNESQSLSAWK